MRQQTETRRELVTLVQLLEQRPWLNERYVRRLVAERRIAFYKPAGKRGRLVFDLADVDAYVERSRVDPDAPHPAA